MTEEETACVRNLGPKQIRRRKIIGTTGLILTLLTCYFNRNSSPVYKLLTFFPLLMTGIGFFQANAKVCVVFAANGVQNMDTQKNERIRDDAIKEKLRQVARSIWIKTITLSVVGTFVAYKFL
eukprot:CAMPEP_0117419298 /NCGR_PEP_ID=MMETSP0758-20121206/893_1 /TAXON_ID=63605 /ORGANISM="Percolomonas cosmopolitus, Strain AE-1 (ATCC 50343)" /LENGTH=122 /DNA_ID=CAMNT_0005200289 /DNA_START=22 /DNA_END=390 /DNA_ORIENTATION=-